MGVDLAQALNMRSILDSEAFPSEIQRSHEQCHRVQDAYSLRCSPQVRFRKKKKNHLASFGSE